MDIGEVAMSADGCASDCFHFFTKELGNDILFSILNIIILSVGEIKILKKLIIISTAVEREKEM